MTETWTVDQYKAYKEKATGSKHRNIRTEYGGRVYDSKAQAHYAWQLDCRKQAGDIRTWLAEVRFDLPGKVKHYVDFMIVYNDYRVEFVEIKGQDRPQGRDKRRQVEELHNVEIKIIWVGKKGKKK